ncbi:MAG: ribosome small subunit-dependent GTPase A [Bacteroidales bacterium]
MKGLVTKSTGSWYLVQLNEGELIQCRLKGKFRMQGIKTTNPIAVGDSVEVQRMKDETGVITSIAPRSNYIIRKSTRLSKQSHIIAANVDQAVIIAAISYPRTSTGFVDRFLVTAEAYNIPAKIVINKADLHNEQEKKLADQLINDYQKVGYEAFLTSAVDKYNVDKLTALLDQKISVIVGHSGTGKSALINAIHPGLNLKIGRLSDAHLKGKHTTTFARMHEISPKTYVVDTPGLKEFGLVDLHKRELHLFFPEMLKRADACRFANCTHVHEPGCAVRSAVEEGSIPEFRYANYLNMLKGKEMNQNPWDLK